MVTASMYVWNIRKLVPGDSETGAQSRKVYSNVDAIALDPTVNATTVPTKLHPPKSETPVQAIIREGRSNVPGPMKASKNMLFKEIGQVKPIKVTSASLVATSIDDIAKKFVFVSQYGRRN